jgi:hypothetical protein
MPEESMLWQFWMNWLVQLFMAVGTILAVVVALFGSWLRSHFAPPNLVLSLSNPRGHPTPSTIIAPDKTQRVTESRWYHLKIENTRRWSPASQTQVLMLEILEPDASGEMQPIWSGMMPLKWRSVGYLPLGQTIGYPAECDVCNAVKDKWLEISPAIAEPTMKVRRREACRFIVKLQARSVEGDSRVAHVEIAWNGQWSDDADEMARNLVVRLA